MGKMDSGPPKGPAPTKKQKEIMEHNKKVIEHERKKKKYMKGKIEDRIKQFVAEIEKQASDIQASENPDLIEMMPKLLKVNFKPMDDIWRAIVHELAQDYGLESFSVGKGEERYVVVCSRQPTHSELAELRGLKKNETKASADPEPVQTDDISPQKSHRPGPSSSSSSSYRSKYSHIIGSTENVEKVEKPVNKSFGLVSASLKRDRRTIEETQIAMREKKMKLKPS